MKPIANPDVAAVFEAWPARARRKLLALRTLILETASAEGVGRIDESLKWGEPAYRTTESGSGTTIRLQWKPSAPDEYSVGIHCQTNLIERLRRRFPRELRFDGNRRIVLAVNDPMPVEALSACLAMALTYHRDKTSRSR